jgi:hypothetical protein
LRASPRINLALAVSDENEVRAAGALLFAPFMLTAAGTAANITSVELGMLDPLAVSFGVLSLYPASLLTIQQSKIDKTKDA